MTEIQRRLFYLQDTAYRDFQASLIPGLDRQAIIGVRMPLMRAYAKELSRSPAAEAFLSSLPHEYYDENILHGLLISQIKDYDACVAALEVFLPHVDNWAVCDLLSPICFKRCHDALICDIRRWLASASVYTVRFGIVMLMTHFLDGDYRPEYLTLVSALCSEEYYIRMAQAWFFATALAKQYDTAVKYIEERRLERWTHNMSIRKARESFRVTPEHKEYLRTLRV